jgi:hypothetical protein
MAYTKPQDVLSPKGSIKNIRVIYDGREHGWSLARLEWDGEEVIGIRWNGGSTNGIPSVGNPQSRGYPTWFVLPEEAGEQIIKMKLNKLK